MTTHKINDADYFYMVGEHNPKTDNRVKPKESYPYCSSKDCAKSTPSIPRFKRKYGLTRDDIMCPDCGFALFWGSKQNANNS